MKPLARSSAVALMLSLPAPQVLAAPASAPQSAATSPASQSYRGRVETIARDLLWANSQMLQSLEAYEDAAASLQKPKRGADAADLKTEAESTKATLLANMKAVRLNAARLGAISPVPRAWKRLDDALIEASWEWSSSLEITELWLQHPSDALKNESAKHARRAQTVLDTTRRSLWSRTEASVARKTYAD